MNFKVKSTRTNVPNINGYTYSPKSIEKLVDQLNTKDVFVDTNTEPTKSTELETAGALVEKGSAKIENNQLTYTIKTLSTPRGVILKDALEKTSNFSIGMCMLATLEDDIIEVEGISKLYPLDEDVGFTVEKI
jgi:hypothetical protein